MLKNRVALVTGAAGGIGSAVARKLAQQGAHVCLLDITSTQSLAEEIKTGGGKSLSLQADVCQPATMTMAVEKVLSECKRIDILVNVAGTVSLGAASNISEAEWDRVHAINLKGTFFACQCVIKPMQKQRYGRIINIGSVLGKNGGNPRTWIDRSEQQLAANVAYGTSKAGVHALTSYLAKELAVDQITVNAVAPGPISSAMTTQFPQTLRNLIPLGRMGEKEDVAHTVAFLASEKSGFITGEIIDVNGGMWCD